MRAVVIVGLLMGQHLAWAFTTGQGSGKTRVIYEQPIRRNYHDTSRYLIPGRGIELQGTAEQIIRISAWLDTIANVPHGQATLEAILNSGNRLTIRHSSWALMASGRTLAPMSDNLTNGRGEDVEILFDARIPDQGSHQVFDRSGEPIEFTAVQNLFHELVHARHQVSGSWRYWDSEGQAIEEENRFRTQYHEQLGAGELTLRAGKRGQQLWWPAETAQSSW
jgi:hypothetical protein